MEDEDISEFDEAISALAEEILEDAPEQVPHPLAAPPPPPPPHACRRKITNRKLKYFINLIKILHIQYGYLHL